VYTFNNLWKNFCNTQFVDSMLKDGFYLLYLHAKKFPQQQNIRNEISDLIGPLHYVGASPCPAVILQQSTVSMLAIFTPNTTSPLDIS
jgi:hypothetical protein